VTEAERYEKSVYKGPKKNETKGRKLTAQESWMEVIEESKSTSPSSISSYIETLSSLDNVPRKEKAFRNFAANSLRLRGSYGDTIITSIWKHLSTVREESLKAKEKALEETKKDKEELKQEDKQTKSGEEKTLTTSTSGKGDVGIGKKKVAKAMRKALKKATSKQLKMKEIRKLIQKKLDSEDISLSKDDIKEAINRAISDDATIIAEGKLVKMI
jgi:mannitol-specific phosphotransferase system IIBC component